VRLAALLAAAAVAFSAPLHAKDAPPTGRDPVAQARAVNLANELRCLVCQNQSIAESNAELAVDLRRQIDEQIGAGKTDREILDFMVARYGDFVLYRPPVRASTLLLWGGPLVLLLIGVAVAWRVLRSRRARADERPLTDEERRDAERLLAAAPAPKKPA
jgi:cytochrome c-type biogenesis protein CcmH